MIYIEMNRDGVADGSEWSFKKSIWAPARKEKAGVWPFWSKILEVRKGDIILHLHGKSPNAYFVGYSVAETNGYETHERPPHPKKWDYSKSFLRARINEFTPFESPISLVDLFHARRKELEEYFIWNGSRKKSEKANIFYVKQSGRLQCQNGAYLSDANDGLLQALFNVDGVGGITRAGKLVVTVKTGAQIATVYRRIGQTEFSDMVKNQYSNKCCFPDCDVSDPRFLIGSHIDRWTDNQALRGHAGNGLCLCLMHDKAFEIGLYTLDSELRIFINPAEETVRSPIVKKLLACQGMKISTGGIFPLEEALIAHRKRVKIQLE